MTVEGSHQDDVVDTLCVVVEDGDETARPMHADRECLLDVSALAGAADEDGVGRHPSIRITFVNPGEDIGRESIGRRARQST